MKYDRDPCPTCRHPRQTESKCDQCKVVITGDSIEVETWIEGEADDEDFCSVACLIARTVDTDITSWRTINVKARGHLAADLLDALAARKP